MADNPFLALVRAIRAGDAPLADALPEAHPSLARRLHFTANVDIARVLLERGAKIDAQCVDHESTPAQWMLGERKDVARFLVTRGAGRTSS